MKQPPVQVGEIPANVVGNAGNDDRELRSLVYKTSSGQDRYILVRNGGGKDDFSGAGFEEVARGQNLRSNADASGHDGRTGEDAFIARHPPKGADTPSG